jgi:hypothetical protein
MRNPLKSAGRTVFGFSSVILCSGWLIAADVPEPKFRAVTLDRGVQIGYGVAIGDVDGDGHKDVLLADKKQFVWYRNPGKDQAGEGEAWKKHILAENLTPRDNVCIAAEDIDGDGKCEVAVGGDWAPADTEKSGAVFYLIPPADRTQVWTPVKLHAEVTTHRMRWLKLGEKKWGLVVVPLHGKGNKNGEGAGVRVLLYHPPAALNDPAGQWKTELVDDTMHATHNFHVINPKNDAGLMLGGKEGFKVLMREGTRWENLFAIQSDKVPVAANPLSKGVGEIRPGKVGNAEILVTVEPMHGNELAVYLKGEGGHPRRVTLTEKLVEGHALACANFSGGGDDQIAVGWRGKPEQPSIGLSVWTAQNDEGSAWRETVVDPDNMACEDLQVADLNGDGKMDIVASGRATKNLKIYLNETTK